MPIIPETSKFGDSRVYTGGDFSAEFRKISSFLGVYQIPEQIYEIIYSECGPKTEYISNIQQAFQKIKATHPNNPISPFFRGCWARVAAAAPGCALSWIAYEFMKTFFNAGNSQDKLDKG